MILDLRDVPITDESKDCLSSAELPQKLCEHICNSTLPQAVAVQGDWGCGKTSLMRRVMAQLRGRTTKEGCPEYICVWLDMWKYATLKDPQRIVLSFIEDLPVLLQNELKALSDGAPKGTLNLTVATERLGQVMRGIRKHHLFSALLSDVLSNVAGLVVPQTAKAAVAMLEEAVGQAAAGDTDTAGGTTFEVYEQLRRAVGRIFQADDGQELDPARGPRGLVFFIDDLDRLDPGVAVGVLEFLQNFLKLERCAFVVAVDYEVIAQGLSERHKLSSQMPPRYFERFFDKIFQLTYEIEVGRYDMSAMLRQGVVQIGLFAESQLQQPAVHSNKASSGALVENYLKAFLRNSIGNNPRDLKRLLQTAAFATSLASQSTNDSNEAFDDNLSLMLFGLLCLKSTFPHIYGMLQKEPDPLRWNSNFALLCGLGDPRAYAESEAHSFYCAEILKLTEIYRFLWDADEEPGVSKEGVGYYLEEGEAKGSGDNANAVSAVKTEANSLWVQRNIDLMGNRRSQTQSEPMASLADSELWLIMLGMLFDTEKQPLLEVQRAFNLLHIIETYEWRCLNDGQGPVFKAAMTLIPTAQVNSEESR
ncbi:MAG: hypothetical protein IJ228_06285 [Succinivibrio sp.]|nr:hypothetical protein [Succinivibrio sp.]